MGRKSQYKYKEKLRIVRAVLGGEASGRTIAQQTGVSHRRIKEWVSMYESQGESALRDGPGQKRYSKELKAVTVEEYLSGGHSQLEVCAKYGLRSTFQLRDWIKKYNSHEEYKQPNNGGAIYMAKGRETTELERVEIVSFCISNNKDYGKAIEKYGVSYQQIYSWVRKYEKDGAQGLTDRRGKRKDKDAMSEVEKLRAVLKLKEAENFRLQVENDLLKKLEEIERGRGQA